MAAVDQSAQSPDEDSRSTLNPAEAATRLSLTPQRLRDLARAGKVACEITQHGKRREYKFDADDVDRLAAERGALNQSGRQVNHPSSGSAPSTGHPEPELARLRAEVDSLKSQLDDEKRGRAVAEARIDELNRTVTRQAQAIRDLTVDGLDPDELFRR